MTVEPLYRNSASRKPSDTRRLPSPRQTPLAQAVSVALVIGAAPVAALAQERALEEITVTATKRAESVMDVPLAITAISGDFIRGVNLNDVKDLIQFTPGITGNSKDSFLDFVSVRGIRTIDFGNGGDPSVSLYKNGLYQGRTGSAVSSLYDIERSEVLRGPQGFLFGRNSVSGAFNIITAKPDLNETGGYVELDVGERGVFVFEGAFNLPVSETFGLRFSGYHSQEDGYVENLAGGEDLISHDKEAVRISARYQTDKLLTDFFLEYETRDQTGTVYRATGGGFIQPSPRTVTGFHASPPADPSGSAFEFHHTRMNGGPVAISSDGRTVNNDNSLEPIDQADILHFGLQIDYDLGWANFTSLTGFKDHEYDYVEDFDASPIILFNYGQDQEGDYIEQEFRLTSQTDGPLSWYAGVSYYEEDIDTVFLGQQAEDAYCAGYWYYSGATNCQEVFDYYNYLDTYYNQTYFCDYYLEPYLGACTWTPTADGLINDRNRIIGNYSGYSAYLDLSYEFSETFDVSLGVRYSYDEKDFSQQVLPDPGGSLLAQKVQTGFSTPNGSLVDSQDWDEVTYRAVANWRPNANSLIYGSITTGYKPGGFGSFNIEPRAGATTPCSFFVDCPATNAEFRPGDFGPETVTSYEVGYKGRLMDGRTNLGITAFVYDYEDLQAIFSIGPRVIVDNVGQVDGQGVEVESTTSLTDNLTVRLGMSWFDSEATGVQAFCDNGETITGNVNVCEGESIPWAPEWTAFAVLDQSIPVANGEFFGRLSWSWEDDYRGDWPGEDVIYQRIKALNQTDLILGYRADNWRLSAYVENLTDEVWYDGAYANDDPNPIIIYAEHTFGPSRPRTFGVRFNYDF